MTEHYENISTAFNDTLFYPISSLNYTYDEMRAILNDVDPKAADMLELVKKACRTEEFFEAMKNEYCRNLLMMLEGHYPDIHAYFDEHKEDGQETNGKQTGTETAISMAVRTVMTAYAHGLKLNGSKNATLRQSTVFRLVLDTVTTLLHDAPIDCNNIESIDGLLMAICLTNHNIDVMTDEMNRMHEELVDF